MQGIGRVLGLGRPSLRGALWLIALVCLSGCPSGCKTEASLIDDATEGLRSAGPRSKVTDASAHEGSGGEATLADAGEASRITSHLLTAYLACERDFSRSRPQARAAKAVDCGFRDLDQFLAFGARVEAMRSWRMDMRAHESMMRAREQTEARLDQQVASGGMTQEQRDFALSFFPEISAPRIPGLAPPIDEAEIRTIEEVNLRTLAPDARLRP